LLAVANGCVSQARLDSSPTSLRSFTGTKFVLLTTPSHPYPEQVLRKIYETYADHLKDPFYTVEMPIRSETFDTKMAAVVRG
jgi:hypothetical protein